MGENQFIKDSLRPPLKWAGGKRWLLPEIARLWDKVSPPRLVEPLCGGLAIALGLNPPSALLNDVNPHLINFFRQVQRGLQIEITLENDETLYYNHRSRFNYLIEKAGANSEEAAQLFYYLNRTGYNGLCRFNRSGLFNVPFGRYAKINYSRDFSLYRNVFKDWIFQCGDFAGLTPEPNDLIYADPPYDVQFRAYSKDGFSWEDQVRLVRWLDRHPGPVVLSNQATDRIVELYRHWGYELRFLEGPRSISCTGDRTPAREVLAWKGF